jgi:protoporphyrinogen oxidase
VSSLPGELREVGVLGGGISGLFVAHFLGGDAEVLEADDRPGGLARGLGGQGFVSDIGGHILFSKDREALAHELAVLAGNLREGLRANKILYRGLHVKYPFENGIDQLPPEERVEILCDFIDNPAAATRPQNFREWMYHVFGSALTDKYLLPYNEKIWKHPLTQMSLEWVERVPRPPLRDLVKTAIGISTEGYTHQLHFQYPDRGGFEALPRALAARLGGRVTTGFRVARLSPCDGGWAVISAAGEERRYRQLVATLPVTTLFAALPDVPPEVTAAAGSLRFNSLRVALVGVGAATLPDYTALYVPDPASIYHRVCFNHAFSPHNVPAGCQSMSCEITAAPGSELAAMTDEALLERTEADLARDGLLDRRAVVHRQVHRERFAYVVYDTGYADRVRVVREYAQARGIHLAGRFAEYQYVNTDACVRRALDLARELRGGDLAPEARIGEAV